MSQVKRQLDIGQSSNTQIKKLRRTFCDKNKLITSIENLSNEVFLEIFEYLDGCYIFDAFSNLNSRFQNLLNSSALLLKIKLSSPSEPLIEDHCTRIIIPNKHRIISLEVTGYEPNNLLFELFSIDASFSRLESLMINYALPTKLESVLISLYSLPRLYSLTIYVYDQNRDFTDIYRIIFGLPLLKYCRFSLNSNRQMSLPVISNKQGSSIKHLVFSQTLSVEELTSIVSYTPQLNRLSCKRLFKFAESFDQRLLITLSSLTHISIGTCYMSFTNFKIFIGRISSQLQVLSISPAPDPTYLDADRWERLITKYMPHLRVFDFQYQESIDGHLEVTSYHTLINRFKSPFWIQRQWFLEIKIDVANRIDGLIIYSIRPSKKRWHNFSEHMAHDKPPSQNLIEHDVISSEQNRISKINQLTLINLSFVNSIELFMNFISPVLIVIDITCLVVDFDISIDILSQVINRLPNLTSLIIRRLSSSSLKTTFIFINGKNTNDLSLNENNTLKLRLETLTALEQIESLMHICPRVLYLELNDISYVDLQSLIQFIVRKYEKNILHHFTLCIKNCQVTDKIIQNLEQMIDVEKNHGSYTFKPACENIYLECKSYPGRCWEPDDEYVEWSPPEYL